jgi:hypothetical protein
MLDRRWDKSSAALPLTMGGVNEAQLSSWKIVMACDAQLAPIGLAIQGGEPDFWALSRSEAPFQDASAEKTSGAAS